MIVNMSEFWDYLAHTGPDGHGFDQVIVPVRSSNPDRHELIYDDISNGRKPEADSMRTLGPLKYLFYQPRETMYPDQYPNTSRIIAGVKACDLKAMLLLDRALLADGFVDPAYAHWRKNTLILTSDCTVPSPACHCTLVEGKTYAEFGYDLNLSAVEDKYYILIGSDAGKAFLDMMAKSIKVMEATREVQELVQTNRHHMTHLVEQMNEAFPKRNGDSYSGMREQAMQSWQEQSNTCIGCGACTHICPTCYCLILNDESNGKMFTKVRSMDSCQYHGYARVAGGGTPRPKMAQRFRNRYLCKFSYMPDNFDMIGCTGCGRCTEACAGQIDFRKVVEKVTTPEAI